MVKKEPDSLALDAMFELLTPEELKHFALDAMLTLSPETVAWLAKPTLMDVLPPIHVIMNARGRKLFR